METTRQDGPRCHEGSSNVLVLTAESATEDAACTDLLTVAEPAHEDVLSITLAQSPDDRFDHWGGALGTALPGRTAFVAVGDPTRSTAVATPSAGRVHDAEVGIAVDVVSTPRDLAGIGIAASGRLREWAADGNLTVVCFHSVDTLLQYAELDRVYEFLYVLTRQVRAVGAVAHYHLDPSEFDAETVGTLSGLFDEVLDPDVDGATTVEASDGPATAHTTFRTTVAVDESPTHAVVRALSALEGVAGVGLDSRLYEWVDPDALDALVGAGAGATSDGVEGDGVHVSFSMEGYAITVGSDGEIVIEREQSVLSEE